MKNIILIHCIVFFAIGFSSCGSSSHVVAVERPAPEGVSYQTFYDELSPYGHWVDYPGYGYVWMPSSAGYDFKPYATNGYWVYSNAGWTWVSNYNWGWAPFHYGRWFFDGVYGWLWSPGYEWAPAWVSWRKNQDYYGWAPLGPNMNAGSMNSYNPPVNYWNFVPQRYVNSPQVNNYYINETKNVTIINNTTVINNNVTNNNNVTTNNTRPIYTAGPDPREVEQVTSTVVRPVTLKETSRPGGEQLNNGQLNIFKPIVKVADNTAAQNTGKRIAPAKVESLRDIKPIASSNNNASSGNNSGITNEQLPVKNNALPHDANVNNKNTTTSEVIRPQTNLKQDTINENELRRNKDNTGHNDPVNKPVDNQPKKNPPQQNNQNQQIKTQADNRNNNTAKPIIQHPQQSKKINPPSNNNQLKRPVSPVNGSKKSDPTKEKEKTKDQ